MIDAVAVPRGYVEEGEAFGDALVSIGWTAVRQPRPFPLGFCRLGFDDIPVREWTSDGRTWRGPRMVHVERAVSFARSVAAAASSARIVVHCDQGKSRSAAVALAILADALGRGSEPEAVARVVAGAPDRKLGFNPGVVRLADRLLGRDGAIERALEAGCPSFVTWRAYWERKLGQGFVDKDSEPGGAWDEPTTDVPTQ
jgi:predicted protein tyrosine phosphatase